MSPSHGRRDEPSTSSYPTPRRSTSVQSTPRAVSPQRSPIQNVFSDEFSLEPLDEPDGHRRDSSLSLSSHTSSKHNRPWPMTSPFDDEADSVPSNSPRPSRPSSVVDRGSHVSIDSNPAARAPSIDSATQSAASATHRSVSTSSRFSMPRALSPYTGQTGASHPYAMYPQGIGVGRSSSTSTVSTIRAPERNFTGATPPQHPYALYSQNTVPEEVTGELPDPLPPGIPGQPQVYPALGVPPPNDVGDIVGTDGYTEQLPPYSRYPDSLPPKEGTPENSTPATNPDETPASPGTRISSQTLMEPTGRTDPEVESPVDTNPDPDDPSGGFKEKMARKGKKKICCGVSIWIFLLIAVVLIIGAAIGGVIGGLLGTQQGAKREKDDQARNTSRPTTVTITPTTILDATPLATTPADLLPLPTGNYTVPASSMASNSSNCVRDIDYSMSWQCKRSGMFSWKVQSKSDGTDAQVKFDNNDLTGEFLYGAQAPLFQDEYYSLRLMQDKTSMARGPAYFFFAPIDKLVIVPESAIPTPSSSSSSKRSIDERDLPHDWSGLGSKVRAQPGEKPWFCWWNSTLVEIFIYVNETIATSNSSGSDSSSITSTWNTSSIMTSTSSTYAQPPEPTLERRSEPSSVSTFYPRAVKMEERRFLSHGVPAYCEQVRLMDDGSFSRPFNTPQVTINELNTGSGPSMSGPYPDGPNDDRVAKRDSSDIGCFCQWCYG